MSDSYLDSLPSAAREKIRRRLRSPAEYERLREKVKGPEDLERELPRAEAMAELHFELQSNPEKARELKAKISEDMAEQGIDAVLDAANLPPDVKKKLEQGKFTVSVTSSNHQEDALVVVPEGTVQEKLPVKPSFSQTYASQLTQKD
jgi:hypothetical protein